MKHSEEQIERLVRELRYQPFYCEENVWWLSQAELLADRRRWVLFMTNERKACAIWHQRAGAEHGFVVWDYHVVLLAEAEPSAAEAEPSVVEVESGAVDVEVWDIDCTLGMPLPLQAYLDASFPELAEQDMWLRPRFRLIDVKSFLERFASDRRHMLGEQGYQQPPPSWPAPRGNQANSAHTLDRFIDLSDDIAGEVLDLAALRARWGTRVD